MDQELKQYLIDMEARIVDRIAASFDGRFKKLETFFHDRTRWMEERDAS